MKNNAIFMRVEKKYLLNELKYNLIKNVLNEHMTLDEYGNQAINNIYYDDDFDMVINNSLERPEFKEKLRLRYYGEMSSETVFYIELKKKYKGVVFKRRAVISRDEFDKYLSDNPPLGSSAEQIRREIDEQIRMKNIYPKLYLSYDREAFRSAKDEGLRVTIDSNVRYRYINDDKKFKNLFSSKNNYLLEIKANDKMPLWLSSVLTKEKIYPVSFSKYGNIYKVVKTNKEALDV